MSRIGRRPIAVPANVELTMADGNAITVKGPRGTLSHKFHPDLQIKRESNSTPWLTDAIWSAAKRLNRIEFVDAEIAVEDDHVPFLQAGVPAVDLIDFDYPEWHQPGDTLDKVSGRSMHVVADVVLAALPEIMAQLSKNRR